MKRTAQDREHDKSVWDSLSDHVARGEQAEKLLNELYVYHGRLVPGSVWKARANWVVRLVDGSKIDYFRGDSLVILAHVQNARSSGCHDDLRLIALFTRQGVVGEFTCSDAWIKDQFSDGSL